MKVIQKFSKTLAFLIAENKDLQGKWQEVTIIYSLKDMFPIRTIPVEI